MRANNPSDMTIVEQIVQVRKEICNYACKFQQYCNDNYDELEAKIQLQKYCKGCPITNLHYYVDRLEDTATERTYGFNE